MERRGFECVVLCVSQTQYITSGSQMGLKFLNNKSDIINEFITFIRDRGQSTLQANSTEDCDAYNQEETENDVNLALYFTPNQEPLDTGNTEACIVGSQPCLDNLSVNQPASGKDTVYLPQNDRKNVLNQDSKKKKFQCESNSSLNVNQHCENDHNKMCNNDPPIMDINTKSPISRKDHFICDQCNATFRLKSLLDAHRNRLLPCVDTTSMLFKSRWNETVYYENSNGSPQSITVSKAFETLKTECMICSFRTNRLSNLRRHFILAHCKGKPFKCSYCKLSFKLEYSLNRHMLKAHETKKFSALSCDLCKKIFSSARHLKFHKVFKCMYRIAPSNCEICGYTTKSNAIMSAHKRLHTGEKPYKCPQCKISLANQSSLKHHMDLHSEKDNYNCKECGMKFKTRARYNIHMKTHKGTAPNQCNICGKEFGYKSTLQYHLMTHTDSKPFVCESCGEAFRKKERLSAHKQQKHSGVKAFHCPICQKGFSTLDSLRVHKLIHGERCYTCDRCGKSFYRKGKLTQHYKIHEKQYACGQCTSTFTSLTDWRKHSKEHKHKTLKSSK